MIDICNRIYKSMEDPLIYRTRGNTGLYPSQGSIELPNGAVAGACHRQVFYQWFKYEPTDIGLVDYSLSAEMGNWMHDGTVKFLKDNVLSTGLVVLSAEQAFFNHDDMVSGRTDIFMMDTESGEIFGVDIKTVGDWMARECLLQPAYSQLIQTAIYLSEYQKTSSQGKRKIDYWILLFQARSETWDLKARAHGSPFKYMWQFWIKFENNHIVVLDQNGNKTSYPEITMDNINNRFAKLRKSLQTRSIPDRDFEAQYSEEKIVALYKSNAIRFKKDITVVEKWLKKGAKEGELNLPMGDKECMFCAWRALCYSADPEDGKKVKEVLFNIKPKDTNDSTPKNTLI